MFFGDGNFIPDSNFSTYRIVYQFYKMDYLSMRDMCTMIIEKDGNFFYLYDELDKINDVIKMPNYIKDDWVIYNRKDINLSVIDVSVKELTKLDQDWSDIIISELKSLRRDTLLKKIL